MRVVERKRPKTLRSMDSAPTDGSLIDLWSDTYGWDNCVWWDRDCDYGPDGWVTIMPRPFTGWRPFRGYA